MTTNSLSALLSLPRRMTNYFSVTRLLRNSLLTGSLLVAATCTQVAAEDQNAAGQSQQLNAMVLSTMQGDVTSLTEYSGKPLLVNFWASWCRPCVKEMPALQRLQDAFNPDEFQVIAVNISEDQASIKNFLQQQPTELRLEILIDETGTALGTKLIDVMPSSFVISPEGKVMEKIIGIREWDSAASISAVQQLIDQ